MFKQSRGIFISLAKNHTNNEDIGDPCDISSGMCGIRNS
jgi:hypothetical protein